MEKLLSENEETGTNINTECSCGEKRLKKWICRILIAIAVLLFVIFIVVAFLLGPLVKFAVNTFGESYLGVDKCSVDTMKIYPLCGYVYVENLVVGKPLAEGSDFSRNLLELKLLDVDADVTSLLSQKKTIDHIIVKDLNVAYEVPALGDSNVTVLLKNINGDAPKEEVVAEKPPQEEPKNANETPTYIGAKFVDIDAVNVSAVMSGIPMPIPPVTIKFEDGIGMGESNLTPAEFGALFAANFMNIFNRLNVGIVGDAAGAATDAVTDVAGAAVDGISGIFKSDDAEKKSEEESKK